MTKIFVAIPAYDRRICMETFTSLLGCFMRLQSQGHKVLLSSVYGDCYVQNARNKLVKEFLATDCDYLLFVDSDMGFEHTAVEKLLSANKPLVFAGYPCKQTETPLWTARPLIDADGNSKVLSNSLMLCESGPTGLMLVKREVFTDMEKRHPEWQFDDHPFTWFDCGKLFDGDNRWYGEDVVFCKRYINDGGECWCYTDIDIQHIGGGVTKGNFYKFLKEGYSA